MLSPTSRRPPLWRRKTSIALLAATAALLGGAQALSPAPAVAMIAQESTEECQGSDLDFWDAMLEPCQELGSDGGGSGGSPWEGGWEPEPEDPFEGWQPDQGPDIGGDDEVTIRDETPSEQSDREIEEARKGLAQAEKERRDAAKALDEAVVRSWERARQEEFEKQLQAEWADRDAKARSGQKAGPGKQKGRRGARGRTHR